MAREEPPSRGFGLSLVLAMLVVANALVAASFLAGGYLQMAAPPLANLLFTFALYRWRRWGLYGLTFVAVGYVVLALQTGKLFGLDLALVALAWLFLRPVMDRLT